MTDRLPEAIVFDFDGVIVDSEPIHLACFQKVLAGLNVPLDRHVYYGRYLGFDDREALSTAMRDAGRSFTERQLEELIVRKTALMKQAFGESVRPQPGAKELIAQAVSAGVPLAVCSGALLEEIELALEAIGVRRHFLTIVSAEDVRRGKPDPEGCLLTLRRLRDITGRAMAPSRCVMCEDSRPGVQAARTAGMRVLAVAVSCPPRELAQADRVVHSLAEVSLSSLHELTELARRPPESDGGTP